MCGEIRNIRLFGVSVWLRMVELREELWNEKNINRS